MRHYEDNLLLFMRTSSQKYMRIAGSNRNGSSNMTETTKQRCFSAISIFGLTLSLLAPRGQNSIIFPGNNEGSL